MGSSAKKFCKGIIVAEPVLWMESCSAHFSGFQDSPEGAILDQALKEAAQELENN